eukprot:2477651-Pleurochrysis_carterae.AAC.3
MEVAASMTQLCEAARPAVPCKECLAKAYIEARARQMIADADAGDTSAPLRSWRYESRRASARCVLRGLVSETK